MPGEPGCRVGRGWLAVLLVLVAAGCATAPERLPPVLGGVPAGEPEALLRRWEAQWRSFRGLRAAVDLTVTRKGRAQRTAGVILVSPTHLRFEAVTPLGLPALVVVAGPQRVLVVSPGERKAWSARPTGEAVARWMGVPIPPAILIRLLAGYVPPPAEGTPVRVAQDRGTHLVFQQGPATARVWVTPEGEPARLGLDDGRIAVTFDRAVHGQLQGLSVDVPSQSLELSLRYISGEDFPVPPEAFELTLPAGMSIETLD